MSMFYELMMRKKEEIMYATIKGTLTENNGVFSGFSASDYLETQKNIAYNNDSWEYLFKFTTGNDVTTQQCICENYYQDNTVGYCGLTLYLQNGAMYYRLGTGNNQVIVTSYVGAFSANTTYYFSVTLDKSISKIIFKSGTSKSTMTTLRETNNSITVGNLNYPMRIGRRHTNNSSAVFAFGGSIDLNESYLKLGSTKYKLQAVVGYTVVGSPTITDGVVSGFTTSDYLQIALTYSDFQNKKAEIIFKYNSPSPSASNRYFRFGTDVDNAYYLRIEDDTTFCFYAINKKYKTNLICSDYSYVRLVTENGFENNIRISCSNDGINWINGNITIEDISPLSIRNYNFIIGRIVKGSIDLNETIIKIDNKLWFNGQQA